MVHSFPAESTSGSLAKQPGAESSLHLHLHCSPSDKCCHWKKPPAGLSAGFPKHKGAQAEQAPRMRNNRAGTASQNPAQGGPRIPLCPAQDLSSPEKWQQHCRTLRRGSTSRTTAGPAGGLSLSPHQTLPPARNFLCFSATEAHTAGGTAQAGTVTIN